MKPLKLLGWQEVEVDTLVELFGGFGPEVDRNLMAEEWMKFSDDLCAEWMTVSPSAVAVFTGWLMSRLTTMRQCGEW